MGFTITAPLCRELLKNIVFLLKAISEQKYSVFWWLDPGLNLSKVPMVDRKYRFVEDKNIPDPDLKN